jgi:glyoxylase-like metal-dependent hydrolase (beta-lactamase superfamily II)
MSGTNVGLLRRRGRALLINSLDPAALESEGIRPAEVDWVVVTHHHRSAAEGLAELTAAGARAAVPEAERSLFEDAEGFWSNDSLYRTHGYNYHPSPRTLRACVPVARGLADGDVLEWEGVHVRAMQTPGPTSGGMTYLVEADGVKVAFIGDLMSGPGRLWEFHSLQGRRALPDGGETWEYHGFGERAADVLKSLDRVVGEGASLLVPSHGQIIKRPPKAVGALRRNIDACLANYYSISAAQWYFAGARPEWPTDRDWMVERLRALPAWVLEPGGTTRAIVGDGGEVILMDAAGDIPARVREQQERGDLGPVEALWITHYHDDHVGSANEVRAQQGCPIIGHESLVDILGRPNAYLMPCLDPEAVAVDRVTRDEESWEWRGIKLTAYSCPGQSIYDTALLAERGDEMVLFVGDSLGPGGIDDYCCQNRNLLGPGLGFDHCLALVEGLPERCVLVNPHVEGAFAFKPVEIRHMRETLAERRRLFQRLIDWDDPNYGLAPRWVRCDPYFQSAKPGDTVEWTVHICNYSADTRAADVGLRVPDRWRVSAGEGSVRIRPGKAGTARFAATLPDDAATGRAVVGFTLEYGDRWLGEMTEGIVDVKP